MNCLGKNLSMIVVLLERALAMSTVQGVLSWLE